ncbi:MAG TPA: peptidoglycan-binding domain-containing protein [Allocoleopsis sp.]
MVNSNLYPISVNKKTLKLPVLDRGSDGSTVRVLQQLLNFKGYALEVDGQFGSLTEQAVKDFQCASNLTVNGIVDSETWHNLSLGILPLTC